MKKKIIISIYFVILLSSFGCGMFFGGDTEFGDAVSHDLDGMRETVLTVEVGEAFVLDMRHPGLADHVFKGAVFDPTLVRLDKFLMIRDEDDAEDPGRVAYLFTPLAIGETSITIKVEARAGGASSTEIFKQVTVVIEED